MEPSPPPPATPAISTPAIESQARRERIAAGWARLRQAARQSGFTLVELITVLALIGLLSAILIPSTAAARVAAKRAITKVQFAQWADAMELFRQEYGFLPAIDGGAGGKIVSDLFAGALTGQALDGTALPSDKLAGNTKLIRFYAIAERELNETHTSVVDAFGNADIAVLYDRNGDGRIDVADGDAVAVTSLDGRVTLTPTGDELDLAKGVRASVIFYSAGNGTTQSDLVFSWK